MSLIKKAPPLVMDDNPKALKHLLNPTIVADMASHLTIADTVFDQEAFIKNVLLDFDNLALKERMWRITDRLRDFLPSDYKQATQILIHVMKQKQENHDFSGMGDFYYWPFLSFVEKFGLDDPEFSLETLAFMTRFMSAEFAIRPYLIQFPELTFEHLYRWAKADEWHLRRLSSEGSRPILPWGIRIPSLVQDPTPTILILEMLFQDIHPNVRLSVANHVNDISKHHPAYAVSIAQHWLETDSSTQTVAVITHGLRTLRKKQDKATLQLLNIGYDIALTLTDFSLSTDKVRVRDILQFSFKLTCREDTPQQIVIYYAIDYVLKNDKTSRKIFKLAQHCFMPHETRFFSKQHSFKPITTRRYYAGIHTIHILAAGDYLAKADFMLEI